MPWLPELFGAAALQRLRGEAAADTLVAVPYLRRACWRESPTRWSSRSPASPSCYDPVRGRIKGERAFRAFVAETSAWLVRRNVVGRGRRARHPRADAASRRSFCTSTVRPAESISRCAIVADRRPDGRIDELRIYFSSWPLTGRHAHRPPLLQPDPELRESDVVADYQRALAAGDVDAIVAAFEPDGYAREPAGGEHVHRGRDGLRSFYEQLFSNGGGIPLEHCAVIDDGRACALEYNVVRWGRTELPPQAGVAVYVRGPGGRLAAARIYDDVDPPLGPVARSRAVTGPSPVAAVSSVPAVEGRVVARVPGVAQPGRARGPSRGGSRA